MNKRLLEHLRQNGYIDEANLRTAIARQQQFGGDLLDLMLRLKMFSERDCARGLASFYRYPVVDLNQTTPDEEALALLDGDYAQAQGILPLRVDHDGQVVDVAVFDPARTLEALDFIRRRTSYEPRPYIAPPTALIQAIAYFYYGELPEAPSSDGSSSASMTALRAGEGSGPRRMSSAAGASGGGFKAAPQRAALRSTRLPTPSAPRREAFDDPWAEPEPRSLGGHVEPLGSAPKIGALVEPVSVVSTGAVVPAHSELLEELDACNKRVERLEELLEHERRLVQVLVDVLGEVGVTSREELVKRLRSDG